MLVMVGLDHRRASVEARGRLSFTGDTLTSALDTLSGEDYLDEIVILSTCNRTEVYLASRSPKQAIETVLRYLSDMYQRADGVAPNRVAAPVSPDLAHAIRTLQGIDVVSHLYHVAAGLRSMVIGEAQILGQVREALSAAEDHQCIGEELRAVFTGALKAGKRVRTETDINRADVSVAGLAIRCARELRGTLQGATVTLIGAGRTNQLSAQLLQAEQVARVLVANRAVESARQLAEASQGEYLPLGSVAQAIKQSDVVISATAAPYTVIDYNSVLEARAGASHPLLMIDLAVPADIDASVANIPGVTLITLDTLRDLPGDGARDDRAIAAALTGHEADIENAERIIDDMLREHTKAQTMRLAAPGIAALRQHVDRSEEQELERALTLLAHLSEQDKAVIERFGARLVDKMFHHLVRRIRLLAEYDEIPPETTMRVLAQLFAETSDSTPENPKLDGGATR